MNPELQKELATWLSQLRNTVEAGANFAVEQAPLIAREAVSFGRAWHTAAAVLFVLLIVALLIAAHRFYRAASKNDWELGPLVIGSLVCVFAACPTFIEGVLPHARLAMLAWFAPRIYIIEWLREIVRS